MMETGQSVVALIADVDGTLVTKEKAVTARAIEAVKRLRERGVFSCITSGRPPRGLRMFVEPLEPTIAMPAFKGGSSCVPTCPSLMKKP